MDFGKYRFARLVEGGLIVHLIPKVAHTTLGHLISTKRVTHISPDENLEGYRFMVVRHPLDRLVSGWAFFTTRRAFPDYMANIGYKQSMGFDEWLEVALIHYDQNIHTDKQVVFTGGHDMDELCALESLGKQWPILARRFGLPGLDHMNRSYHKDWEEYYTPKQRARAEEVFADDMKLYNKALRWEKSNG